MVDGNVTVPGFGSQKKQTVYIVGGVFIVIGMVAYARHRKAQQAALSTAVDPNAIDPATGYAFGTGQDAGALAGQSAYQNPVAYGGGGGPPSSQPAQAVPFTSNSQWEQAAVDYLSNVVGIPATTVSHALGAYLAGTAVDAAGKSIIEQAIASEGLPPVAGSTSGYPPAIRLQAVTIGPTKQLARPVLRIYSKTATHVGLAWTQIPNTVEYILHRVGHADIKILYPHTFISGQPLHSVYSVSAAAPGKYYTSAPSNNISV